MMKYCLVGAASILVLAILVMSWPAPSSLSPVSAGTNLIQNPGFEEPTGDGNETPTHWTPSTTSPYRGVFPEVHSGSYSAYLHGPSGSYQQTVSVGADAVYRFEAYTRANASAIETVTLDIRDSSGSVLDIYASGNGTDHGWARRIAYIATPADSWDAVITLAISGDANAQAWFDDIVLEEKVPSWCFIATATYGTGTAEQLDVLRAFRDQVLMESSWGSQFAAWYYRFSPPVARLMSQNGFLRESVRGLLVDPMVRFAALTRVMWGD